MKFFLITLLLVSCSGVKPREVSIDNKNTIGPFFPEVLEGLWIKSGCSLTTQPNDDGIHKMRSLNFPGEHCAFLPDGRFVSASATHLRMFSRDKVVLWEINGHFHHQVNLSVDGSKILALSSEVIKENDKKIRHDLVLIADLNGKILSKISSEKFLNETGLKPLLWKESPTNAPLGTEYEASHLNSVYEIPANDLEEKIPWLKRGNIIVNSVVLGIFVFPHDLSRVLHHMQIPASRSHKVHDVQVTSSGEILYFNNRIASEEFSFASAIQKWNPLLEKLSFNWTASPKVAFYSPACGGVQEIKGHIVFSHITSGVYLYSLKKNQLVSYLPGKLGDVGNVNPVQDQKLVNVTDFLKNSGQ